MPTLIVYDTANADNWAEQQNGTWATVRSLPTATGTALGTTATIEAWNNTFTYSISRGILSFNTSSLGLGASVTGVSLTLTAVTAAGTSNGSINYLTSFAGTVPLTTSGFNLTNFGNSFASTFGSFPSIGLTPNGTYTLTGGTDLIAAINVTGSTNLGLVTDKDFSNITPSPDAGAVGNLWFNGQAGTTLAPYLTITYSAGGNWLGKYRGA